MKPAADERPINWAFIYRAMGERYAWASPEVIGDMTPAQLAEYLKADGPNEWTDAHGRKLVRVQSATEAMSLASMLRDRNG